MPLTPALGRQRQASLCDFQASLVYRASSWMVRATQRDPVWRKETKQNNQNSKLDGRKKGRKSKLGLWGRRMEGDFIKQFTGVFQIICSELNLFKTNNKTCISFIQVKTCGRTLTKAALHFSLKRNVYLNQINNPRETSDFCSSACKSYCLHSQASPPGDTFVSRFVSYNKDKGGKCIPVLKSIKSSLLFRV